jgi:hypothetical protein
MQTSATKEKTIEEIGGGNDERPQEETKEGENVKDLSTLQTTQEESKAKPRRRYRHKTHSTPVVGGGLFGEVEARSGRDGNQGFDRVSDYLSSKKKQEDLNFSLKTSGVHADITIHGEVFQIRISENTYEDLKTGTKGQTTDSRGVAISGIEITAQDDAPVVQRLQGFVRNTNLSKIQEEDSTDGHSEFTEESNVKESNVKNV